MPLKARISLSAQRTIRDAFEDLQRVVTPNDSLDFRGATIDSVQNAVLEIENQLAARQSLCNMRRLGPLFRGLEYYSKSIDILCNGTPYLPWIWAPIKVVVKVRTLPGASRDLAQ